MNRSQLNRHFGVLLMTLNIMAVLSRPASAQAPAAPGDSPLNASQAPPAQLTLDWLIREALSRNPEIRAEMREVDAKRARVSQAGALPDPIVMFGQINEGNIAPFTRLGKFDFSEVYLGFT